MRIREDLSPARRRVVTLFVMVLAGLTVVGYRLVDLQLVHGQEWYEKAENNRLRRLPADALRGRIYDRRGEVLADNVPTYQLLLFPEEASDLQETQLYLSKLEVAPPAILRERVQQRPVMSGAPVLVTEDLTWEQVARIRAHQSDHPELAVVHSFRRVYPHDRLTAHAVGYLRPITEAELDANPDQAPTTLVGATGVEALANGHLSGRDGVRFAVVDSRGRQLGLLRSEPSVPGRDLTSTLDLELQRVAAEALGDEAGAVIGIDPRSGAVRVFYSSPSFDPNLFTGRISSSEWRLLTDDPLHPLQNRVVQGVYPPGSTIKPFMAVGGYTEGVVNPSTTTFCPGGVSVYGHYFRCWSSHGTVAMERSIEVSCDVYYYLLGQKLGIDRVNEWMHAFGFERLSGLGISGEAKGLIGDDGWSREARGHQWYPGETISVSIGQGVFQATPIQLVRAFAALANRGHLVTPHLFDAGDVPAPEDLGLDPQAVEHARQGVWRVVHGGRGTARKLKDLPVAGKTGTAQVVQLDRQKANEDMKQFQHHAWFGTFGPFEEPELAVVVLVEHGGGGSTAAAPVAGRVMEAFLDIPLDLPG